MDEIITKVVIVLCASTYVIKDDKTGEVENSGCSVRYVGTSDLTSPFEDKDRSRKGYRPLKATMKIEDYDKFREVPALYEVTLELDGDSQGNTLVKAKDFRFLSGLPNSKATTGGKINVTVKDPQ
jgi:hypothetical protein